MESLLNALTNWGCDVNGAIARFAEDKELYFSYVVKFSKDEEFALLFDAIEGKNYTEAFEYAHSLKGVSGNLGLTPLYVSIGNLVEVIRHKEIDQFEGFVKSVKEQFLIYQKVANEKY